MSIYPVALITAVAAGREDDLLTQLEGVLSLEDATSDPRVLRVDFNGKTVRFGYRRVVAASGVDTLSVPARPSSGTNNLWHLWILQPYDGNTPASWVKAFRDNLSAWAAARQPTAGGLWHLLGPYTPDAFKAVAPAAAVAAVKACWWTFWRSESSMEGIIAQQDATDADLED
jgi:hypothetical protein